MDEEFKTESGLFLPPPRGKAATSIVWIESGASIVVDGDPDSIRAQIDQFLEDRYTKEDQDAPNYITFKHAIYGTSLHFSFATLMRGHSIGSHWLDFEAIKGQQEQMERALKAQQAGISLLPPGSQIRDAKKN